MQADASFEERGYKIEAYMTTGEDGGPEWYVKATKDELIREIRIPMTYVPRFGPDVSDVRTLEEKTEELLKDLP